ncbi:unnamed protein product [Microthlaspi erraticum]|uniref:Uncharacterized protein n=1 Tax=Microthlaspi erraticum TaxID=1685480 RepID=A0A6D2ILS9_9BRAS|nr:unnamed protein product [Microthlaspi erraticum]
MMGLDLVDLRCGLAAIPMFLLSGHHFLFQIWFFSCSVSSGASMFRLAYVEFAWVLALLGFDLSPPLSLEFGVIRFVPCCYLTSDRELTPSLALMPVRTI